VTCFYRAFEQPNGNWWCQRGHALIDEHVTLNDALAHFHELAEEDEALAYLYAHWHDGRVELMGAVDTKPQP
jgi:hypothetical protein